MVLIVQKAIFFTRLMGFGPTDKELS
jgi:hypothetical protein